jgi:hypothetical protein
MDKFQKFLAEYQDHGAPLLDVYEQAIYIYIVRHTLLNDLDEAVIGFKSARKKMAFGVGKAGTAPSETIVYEKLRSLERKGFIKIVSSERTGTRISLLSPFSVINQNQNGQIVKHIAIEDADFFVDQSNRILILKRDGGRCFYCTIGLDENNYVIEHVISRPIGDNSFKNLVASCRQCNNRKDSSPADDFLRRIYRDGLLSQSELADRLNQLKQLQLGNLKPDWPEVGS